MEDTLESIVNAHKQKLEKLKSLGIDPYPAQCGRTHTVAEARQLSLDSEGANSEVITLAGRIMANRAQGGVVFFDLEDFSGKLQLLLKKDAISQDLFDRADLLDIGDFIEARGSLFTTKRGELTLLISDWHILTKSLMPLPEKWHGLKDMEQRYREREQDLIMNPELRRDFVIKAKVVLAMRKFLEQNGFVEVDTPVLQNVPGGTSAKPFLTHYNAYDMDVYLRIAPEIYLKRLLVGGFERVYEFARCFRNEGVDAAHNPDFTNLEFYAAYWDEEQLMNFTEDLVVHVTEEALGRPEVVRNGQQIKLTRPFKRVKFMELTGGQESDAAFREGIKKIIEPTFVTHHPTDMLPLAKRGEDPAFVRSFQLVIGGVELLKAFSELNDPIDQEARLDEQEAAHAAGDEEAQRKDEDFLRALRVGMPPAAGWGMGIERFLILLLGKNSIREVLLFPYMRPTGRLINPKSQIRNSK